jgi:hypothetical protein
MTLRVEELDEETRRMIGIEIKPPIEQLGERMIVLGKIFRNLKGLSEEGALWVLQQALLYILEQHGNIPNINEKTAGSYVPPIGWTIQTVSNTFNVSTLDLKRRGRNRQLVLARQVAMYVLYRTQKYSLLKIGHHLGDRSPATVSHGFQNIARRLNSDPKLREKIDQIYSRLLID